MSCLIYPQVKNKEGEFVDSELFKLLLSMTQDRETTKMLYQVVSDSNWLSKLPGYENVEPLYDTNGELTIHTISQFMDLESLMTNDGKIKLLLKPFVGKTYLLDEAIKESNKFNEANPDYLALINRTGESYSIAVALRNDENLALYNKTVNTFNLNDYILSSLKRLGVNVEVGNDRAAGSFNPQGYEKLADGTSTMIRIAHGLAGLNALSEEFSHYVVRLLYTEPLIQRGIKLLMDENAIKLIMPEELYNQYMELYQGDRRLMAEEALGKILAAKLSGKNNDNLNLNNQTLIDRIVNFIKNLFGKMSLTNIDNALSNLTRDIEDFSQALKDGSLQSMMELTGYEGDQFGNIPLLSINKEAASLEKIANDVLENLVKRYKMYLDRAKGRGFSVEEKKRIKKLQESIDSQLYIAGLSRFLTDSSKWMNDAATRMNKLHAQKETGLANKKLLQYVSALLRDIRDFISAYLIPMHEISLLSKSSERGDVQMDLDTANTMSAQADLILGLMRRIMDDYDQVSFQLVHNYFKEYFGDDKTVPTSGWTGRNADAGKVLTLEMVMQRADKDINFINRFLDSAADSGDIMVALFDKAIKATLFDIRMQVEHTIHELREAHNTLKEVHGISDTSFMYEKDENNVPTGFYISPISYSAYNKARALHELDLINQGTPEESLAREMRQWEADNTELLISNHELGRWERFPKASLYPSQAVNNLSAPQKAYYDKILSIKYNLDSILPETRVNKYKAPLIRTDTTEAVLSNLSNPAKAAKMALQSVKDQYVRTENDDEFGLLEELDGKYTAVSALKDFRGNRILRVPIYFTHMLKDLTRLSMDATSGMAAYASSAINFRGMNNVVDILELGRDIMREREVVLTKAGKILREKIDALGTAIKSEVTKKGSETNIMNRLDDLFNMNVYGEYKLDEGTLFGTKLDQAKTLDNLATATSFTTLGLNVFSGINNIVMGKFLMFLEGVAGEYFNLKDVAVGDKNYMAMLPEALNELGSTKLTSKLGLLRELFDVDLNAMVDARHLDYYKAGIARIFGNTGVMFLQNAGEHYMSSRTLLAYLNAYKMKDTNGKEVSLFDALEVRKTITDGKVVGAHIDLKDGFTRADGSKFTLNDIRDVSLTVAKINQSMHGIYNRSDRNAILKWAIGRLAMVFRKWMVPHYNRRFKGMYYDAQLNQWKEGFYRTTPRFLFLIYNDIRNNGMKNIPAMWGNLTKNERANVKRALTETGFFIGVAILLGAMGDWKDKDTWAGRMLLYLLRRLKLELGTSSYPPMMVTEARTILLSPTAAMKTGLTIINTLSFTDLFKEIESGKYKGHSMYYRNFDISIPVVSNIKKVRDLATEDYMFTMFK